MEDIVAMDLMLLSVLRLAWEENYHSPYSHSELLISENTYMMLHTAVLYDLVLNTG